MRSLGVRLKLNPLKQLISGKRICLVDDSIVRGTTSLRIVEMLRNAGAREVHVLISSPPVISPCFYGIDTSAAGELVAARLPAGEIAREIGADSLGYLSMEGMTESVGLPAGDGCTACFSANYPAEVPSVRAGRDLFDLSVRAGEEDNGGCGGCGNHL